jgi:hypothetical protein
MRKLIFIVTMVWFATGCDPIQEEGNGSQESLVTVQLVPTSDVANTDVVGVGDTALLFRNVDDGATAAAADDSLTYVRGKAAIATTSHTVGYSGAPAGTVTDVTVQYRAQRGSAQGTAQALLYDGTTLIGTGVVRTMGSWASYTDTFSGLAVSDANRLRTKLVFHNTAGTGAIRYTQVFLGITYGATSPPPDAPTCTPTTCAALGDNCGSVSDGCGGTLTCGSCTAPDTCGGGGTPNVCGAAPTGDTILVGAGDIAGGSANKTADLIKAIPGTVFTLGDNAYSSGTASEFMTNFDPTWGQFKSRILFPTPGNHDYLTANASAYFSYFGAAAGDPTKGYYSKDLGGWHIIVLNANCSAIGGCGVGSPQEVWLRADLAAHPTTCTLAMWHHPLFNIGQHGPATAVKPLFQALYDANADVVLTGHDHDYQRWKPLDPNGVADATRGIREFVVGTGGIGFYTLGSSALVESQNTGTYGVLKMTLRASSYSWEFIHEAGKTFTDSGTTSCH